MKVVCMCQGGNSRSVAAAFVLKYGYNVDALSLSWEKNSVETKLMLFEWADRIIIMQTCMKERVPQQYWNKLVILDVGEDVWCNGLHPALVAKVDEMLKPIMV